MEQYRDKILFEVTGHDHLADLRTHILNDTDEWYLNKVLFPGLTSSEDTNPGFGTFEYDSDTGVVNQLKWTYIDTDKTIGYPEETPFDELPWFVVDFESKYELMDLSGSSIASMTERLSKDTDLAREYMFNRMGVNTDNPDQVRKGLKAYKDNWNLIDKKATPENAFTRPQDFTASACIMTQSLTKAELQKCVDSNHAQFKISLEDWEKFLINWDLYWQNRCIKTI